MHLKSLPNEEEVEEEVEVRHKTSAAPVQLRTLLTTPEGFLEFSAILVEGGEGRWQSDALSMQV